MTIKPLTLLTLAALVGCSGERGSTAAADSAKRDLQLMPVDSSAPLNDRPVADQPAAAPAAPVTPPAPRPKPRPAPAPVASAPAPAPVTPAPAPAAAPVPVTYSLAAGTVFPASVDQEINSQANKAGDSVTATVASDVRDGSGHVVIPAGSKMTLLVALIHESENKSDSTGKLTLTPKHVTIAGQTYDLEGSAVALDRQLRDRKTGVGDVAKVGAGAAVGAVLGRILGKGKGAVIGGVVGGAVGAQRAAETKDRDVVVPIDSRVEITLQGTFSH